MNNLNSINNLLMKNINNQIKKQNLKNKINKNKDKLINDLRIKTVKCKEDRKELIKNLKLSKKDKFISEELTNVNHIIPVTGKNYLDVYYDPEIDEFMFIIPKGTLLFRGEKSINAQIPNIDAIYTYPVPCMCFGVNGFSSNYRSINTYKTKKDLKFILTILPSSKTRFNLRKNNKNNSINENSAKRRMKTTYIKSTDPTLEPIISKIKKIDGIISIAGMDSFYDKREKKT